MSSRRHVRSLSLSLVFKCLSIGANAICAGGIFTFPLLCPRLVSHLKFNQLQLTTIVLTGMVSQYPLAFVAGRTVDCYGPQTCSLIAAIFYCLSFGGISVEISRWPDELSYPPPSTFHLFVFYSLMAGFATVFSYYSSLFASSKTFPNYIGISSGASMALFGLSPLFLTTIATKWFTDDLATLDPVKYMSFLAALTGTVHLAGALALKVPGQKVTASNLESNLVLIDENTSLLHHLPDGPILRAATVRPDPIPPLKDPSFWMLALFCLFALGPAEMVISNIATIFLALPSRRPFPPSSTNSAARQVQLLSISNTAVRVITGLIADLVSPAASLVNGNAVFYRKHFISRVFFMTLPSLLLALTFLWTSVFAKTQTDVWVLSFGVGVSYGTIFTILPSIVSAIWGMDDLGGNFGILMNAPFAGTTIFSYLYALVSQAHTKADGMCIGSSCWQLTFWISAGTSLISLGLSVNLWQKWRGRL